MSNLVFRKALSAGGPAGTLALTLNGPSAWAAPGGSNCGALTTTAGDLVLGTTGLGATGGLTVKAVTGYVGVGTLAPAAALDVSGSINFTDKLLFNGAPYVGSQWTTVAGPEYGLTYASNVRIAGTLYASNLAVLGSVETINAFTTMSSNLVIANAGTGPALAVSQTETGVMLGQPVATFSAGSNLGAHGGGRPGVRRRGRHVGTGSGAGRERRRAIERSSVC